MVRTMRTVSSIEMERGKYMYGLLIPGFDKTVSEHTVEFPIIQSTAFIAGEIKNKKLFWHVELKGFKGEIECALVCDGSDERDMDMDTRVDCSFKIGLGNRHDPFHIGDNDVSVFAFHYGENRRICWSQNVSITEVFKNREVLLRDNSLLISIEMEIFNKPATLPQVSSVKRKFHSRPEFKKMSQDFKNLFESKKFSDFEIQCEDKSFFCHKNILAARSKIFAVMFDQPEMSESLTSKVVITDLQPIIMQTLLNYIYTGKVVSAEEMTGELWLELIHGAEKYELLELKQYCFDEMMEHVDDGNVAYLATAAYMYAADKKLMKEIRKYCQTHIARLMKDPKFRAMFVAHSKAFYNEDDESFGDDEDDDK